MFNQKKINDLIDRLNKSGDEVQRLRNEIKKLKGETMPYLPVPTPEERVRKFLSAAARLFPEFKDAIYLLDTSIYHRDCYPLAVLDIYTERFTKIADTKEEKERVKSLVKEILAEQCKDTAQPAPPSDLFDPTRKSE